MKVALACSVQYRSLALRLAYSHVAVERLSDITLRVASYAALLAGRTVPLPFGVRYKSGASAAPPPWGRQRLRMAQAPWRRPLASACA